MMGFNSFCMLRNSLALLICFFHIFDDNTSSRCFMRHNGLNSVTYLHMDGSNMVANGPRTVYRNENTSQPMSPSKLPNIRMSNWLSISGSSYWALDERMAESKMDDNS